jgi:hypothetical protein
MHSVDLFPKITQFLLPLGLFSPCIAVCMCIHACVHVIKLVCTYMHVFEVCLHVVRYVYVSTLYSLRTLTGTVLK